MGFLKKKKSHQASPSQGGKSYGSIISPAHTLSSVFARSPSSATIDDSRNDVVSDGRSVSNHNISAGISTASKASVKHINHSIAAIHTNNNITVASPLSMGSGEDRKEVRDKPTSSSTTSAAAALTMPPLAVPRSKPTKKSMSKPGRTKAEQKQRNPLRRHSPNKSEKMKHTSKANGNTKINKLPRGMQSEDGSSYNSMGADDERESYSVDDDDDERTEESERSIMYTDNSSNSFVSLGYRNSHSKSTSFGISQSTSSENTGSTSTSNEGEEEEEEDDEARTRKESRQISNRDRSDSTWFVSGTDTATSMSSLEGPHFKEKKCLKKLNSLVAKAKNETNGADKNSALNAGVPTSSHTTTKGKDKSNIHGTYSPLKKNTGCDSVASTDANSSKASISTAVFMKTMEEHTVKNAENQLLLTVKEHGNVQKLSLQEITGIPIPMTTADVVIKVDCSTITLQDCMIRRGQWYVMQNLPFIPGSDIVGTILSMGIDATKNSSFQIGDKVASIVLSGGNAKYITVPYQNIIRVPTEVDDTTALSMLSTYVPARESLDLARKWNTPLTGANVLIIGGNGPSGLAMIELALLEAAHVYTTADERHHAYLTSLGVQCFPINPQKWLPTLQGKMDVVLDSVCLDMYESSRKALNSTGTLVCMGMSAVYTMGHISACGLRDVRDYKAGYCKMKAKYFMYNGVYYDKLERYNNATIEFAQHFRYLCHLASKGTVKPVISTCVPLKSVASVQRAIELGETAYGVCICRPWADQEDVSSSAKVHRDSEKSSSN